MQITAIPVNIRKAAGIHYGNSLYERYSHKYKHKVELWVTAKRIGGNAKDCQMMAGISKATYYRHAKHLDNLRHGIPPKTKRPHTLRSKTWAQHEITLVQTIRKQEPTWGKNKIVVILKREYKLNISESTVGRILTHLKEKGLITKSISAARPKRARVFNKHATAWSYKDYKDFNVGERVQIDHMTTRKNGITCKHFQAWERRSKYIDARVFSCATSKCARDFLYAFVKQSPFPIHSIQVDGGSEFMDAFEKGCASLGIELIVLPPAKPTYNGGVERGNRIFKEEFYMRKDLLADSIGSMNRCLKKFVHKPE